jgi:hypothetical protein
MVPDPAADAPAPLWLVERPLGNAVTTEVIGNESKFVGERTFVLLLPAEMVCDQPWMNRIGGPSALRHSRTCSRRPPPRTACTFICPVPCSSVQAGLAGSNEQGLDVLGCHVAPLASLRRSSAAWGTENPRRHVR